jgi:ribonuclease-3
MELNKVEQKIGYTFRNKILLQTAITHKSYSHEYNVENNERLEFLGDTILNMTVTEYIFLTPKNISEGNMTKIRSEIICEDCLYQAAINIGYGEDLLLGCGEEKSGGRNKPSILSDAFEAITAAIYLDGGIENAKKFVLYNLINYIDTAISKIGRKDSKTALQEILQEDGEIKIESVVVKEKGPEHDKTYEVVVKANDKVLGQGVGKSKREAEQEAAREAIEKMK